MRLSVLFFLGARFWVLEGNWIENGGGEKMRLLSLGIFLFVFWLVLSGLYKTHLIVLGILSCLLCAYLARRMKILDEEGHPAHLLLKAPIYFAWLVVEIVKSALTVTRIIMKADLPISPTLVDVEASQKTGTGVNIFGNSITLTPGTVTVYVSGNDLKVHALTDLPPEEFEEMDRWVSFFEGGK